MKIRLDKVKETEKEILYRLLQFSLFEESAGDQNEMSNEAIYEYKWFEFYFIENDQTERVAYFIR